jgi:hypothetical protein
VIQSDLIVRATEDAGEVEISGTVDTLLAWADALTRDDAEITTGRGADPSPYARHLAGVRVRTTPHGLVEISFDEEAQALTFTGSRESMEVLVQNIRGLCQEGVPGEHLHIEYFPDHFYLAESRIALVVARVD